MSVSGLFSQLAARKRLAKIEDAVRLFETAGLHQLGAAANEAKRRRFGDGDKVFWINNLHVNYTNICEGTCKFCTFRRRQTDPDAFRLHTDQILQRVSQAVSSGACEVHLVGGLDKSFDLTPCLTMIGTLRGRFPNLFIKAFTAVEIDFFARGSDLSIEAVLTRLRDAGLDCLAGGGAEIFADRVRAQICPEKIDADRWLEIHRTAHTIGLYSNATMLFGHIETIAERADHLFRLRRLQDETGRFLSFLPIPVVDFHDRPIDGIDALKTLAISRLILDNIAHIKVFWPIWTAKLAQLALSYGADDLDGTVGDYKIVDQKQSASQNLICPDNIRQLIAQADLKPIERTGDYCETSTVDRGL